MSLLRSITSRLSMLHARLAIGLVQSAALYFFTEAVIAKHWLAAEPYFVAPFLTAAIFVPLIIQASLGTLPLRTLTIWTVTATALCTATAWYQVFRGATSTPLDPALLSWTPLLSLATTLFILQALVASAAIDKKFIANYPTYFEVSWTYAVQLVLVAVFVAILWMLLFLGAGLFSLIKIDVFLETIRKPWFWVPVTVMAVTYALHVTDASASLVRGARILKLTLLSWLLPIMAVIATGFVLTLPFTGLEALWSTKHATFILLTAVGALVLLINAAYQDGTIEQRKLLRIFFVAGAAVITPLVLIAGHAVLLRVDQYGWTPQRVMAFACVIVAGCYALGYASAIVKSRWLATANVATAFVIVAVLLALHSPIADPARLAVADQVARLDSGRTTLEKFDMHFLRFGSGRYGKAALEALAERTEGPYAATIAERAKFALRFGNQVNLRSSSTQAAPLPPPPPPTPKMREVNIKVVHPAGRTLPEDFLKQDWDPKSYPVPPYQVPACLIANVICEAMIADLDGDGAEEIAIWNATGSGAALFKRGSDNWIVVGALANLSCPGVREALRDGRIDFVPAIQPKDIQVAGVRLHITNGCSPRR